MNYKDLADLPEDDRIAKIVAYVRRDNTKVCGFIVDDEVGKEDRYIEKIRRMCPGVRVVHQGPGPVPNSRIVKVMGPVC